jgi:hypothetical protein
VAEVIAPAAFIVANLIIYWSGWDVVWKLMLALLIGFAILAVNHVLSPPERRPSLDMKAAYWLVPYLGGLTVISLVGAKDFGGRGFVPFGWDALLVGVFSVAIYVLTIAMRLSAEAAHTYITELSAEAEAEEAILAQPGTGPVGRPVVG